MHINYLDIEPAKVPGMPCVTESIVSLGAIVGDQNTVTVDLSNRGLAGAVKVETVADLRWFTVTMADQNLEVGKSTDVTLTADATGLAPGSYEGTSVFRGAGGEIQVQFEVEALPEPEPEPTTAIRLPRQK